MDGLKDQLTLQQQRFFRGRVEKRRHILTSVSNSCKTLIGVHEIHGRIHLTSKKLDSISDGYTMTYDLTWNSSPAWS